MAYDFAKLKVGIQGVEKWLEHELQAVRTGRATPTLLDSIKVEVYGSMMGLNQLSSITVDDARTLYITPWDKGQIKPIEKALTLADLGVGVGSDDKGVRVTFPELTAERRTQLIKLAHGKLEEARVSMKGERTRAMEDIEKKQKNDEMSEDDARRAKDDAQKMIDAANKKLEEMTDKKDKELAA